MKTEKIVYIPEVLPPLPKKKNTTAETSKHVAKNAALLTAAMLSLASIAKAEVNMKKSAINPYDLSYESTNEFDRNWFKNYVQNYDGLKRFSRVDKNTLRTINEADMVVDHIIKDGVHDTVVLGFADIPDLYPNGHDVPLSEQKYDDFETYEKKKKIANIELNMLKYGFPIGAGAILMLVVYNLMKNDKQEFDVDDSEDKMYGYGSRYIDNDDKPY